MGDSPMKRAVLYLRVSALDQPTAKQERELREVASRIGCEIVKVYKDHGISVVKGCDKRYAFDAVYQAARRRRFDFFFQAEDGIRDHCVTGVQTCALPI